MTRRVRDRMEMLGQLDFERAAELRDVLVHLENMEDQDIAADRGR